MGGRRRLFVLAGGLCCAALIVLALFLLLRPGTVYENDFARITVGRDGLFIARVKAPTERRVRLAVQKDGGEPYLYELDPSGSADAFSFTEGGGDYTVTVYEQTEGTRYLPRLTQVVSVAPADETRPFLHPTRMVPYSQNDAAVQLAAKLTAGLASDAERLDALTEYITTTLVYDAVWAAGLQSGYIPDLDAVLTRGGGNCLDLATLLCAMLRAEGIPARLVVGYVGGQYHAWVNAYVDGAWLHRDPTFLLSDPEAADSAELYRAVYLY